MEIYRFFNEAIQPLAPEELAQLEANIKAYGCRDPLVTWNDIIVDGHHRHEICQRLDIPFQTVAMEFPDRETAKVWMLHNQLGRRNLNDFQRSEISLQLEEILKAQAKERQGVRTDLEREPNIPVNLPECDEITDMHNSAPAPRPDRPARAGGGETREALAKTAGVSGRTIDKVKAVRAAAIPEVQNLVRAGEMSIHAASQIADLPEETQEEIAQDISEGVKASESIKKHVHVAQNSGENEWYTPSNIIEAARRAMGSIDCDPASCPLANETVKAAEFFTKDDDGLSRKWHGNVWLNPPYAQPLIRLFCEAAASKFETGEFNRACMLVNNATETQWFQRLLSVASGVCFPASRVRFARPEGNLGAPLQGQAILYLGDNFQAFADAFNDFGSIMCRHRWH